MKVTIEISMDNAAFEEGNGAEIARILCDLSTKISESDLVAGDTIKLRDINGNKVGFFEVEE